MVVRLRKQVLNVGSMEAEASQALGLQGSLAGIRPGQFPVVHILLTILECRATLMLKRKQASSRRHRVVANPPVVAKHAFAFYEPSTAEAAVGPPIFFLETARPKARNPREAS